MATYKIKVPIVGYIIMTVEDADSEDDVWNFIDEYEFTADDWVDSDEFSWQYEMDDIVIKSSDDGDDWHKEGDGGA